MSTIKELKHLAVIMDGNGRWAKLRGMPRNMGHRAGIKALHRVVEAFQKLGGKYLTVFAFSTENWDRPEHEVSEIMRLVSVFAKRRLRDFKRTGIKLNEKMRQNKMINYFLMFVLIMEAD